jgi:hypothetical protein
MKTKSAPVWIECNLPWYKNVSLQFTIPPDLSEKEREAFGKSYNDILQEITDKVKTDFIRELDIKAKLDKGEEVSLDDQNYYNDILQLRDLVKKIGAWWLDQPETKEYQAATALIKEKREDVMKASSFTGAHLNKAGTLIEIEENGEIFQYLIGDVNESGGSCDDCMMFSNNAIVKRYKVLLENG